MGIVFRSGRPNFPKDFTEFKNRFDEIKKLINNDDDVSIVNIKFCLAAFKLMEDCDLITEDNINFLCSAQSCKNFNYNFRFPFNPDEGALRYVTDDNNVLGMDGLPRFYYGTDRRVDLHGEHYLISNDWYKDNNAVPNKRAFYNWLKKKAENACQKKREEDEKNTSTEKISVEPEQKKVPVETENLLRNLVSIVARIDSRIENLEKILGEIKSDVSEIKNMWK